jgi:ribosomal protein S18 acetylase RimI-like enzyme
MEEINDIVRLTKNDILHASEVLAKALYNDPLTAYFFPDLTERDKKLPIVFEFIVRYGIFYGEVYSTSENLEGVMILTRSEKVKKTLPRLIRSGGVKVLLNTGWSFYMKQKAIADHIDMAHERYASSRHWYLDPLGVEPIYQGKGYGGKLMRCMLKRVDTERLPIYLYTTNDSNVKLYERYGFKVVGSGELPGTGVMHWSMVRESYKL